MKLKRIFLLLILSITSIFATINTDWNKKNIFIEVNKKLLQGDNHLLNNFSRLKNFYANRQNTPVWLSSQGIKGQRVMQLLSSIQRDVTLDPRSHIHRKAKMLKKRLAHKHNDISIKRLELELTTLYYDFLQHTIYGEID